MTRVAFQGERGAYSEEAIRQHFGSEAEPVPCRRFDDIFEAVESGAAEYGMQPVENSTAGSINQAYDLLLDHDLRIWGEAILRVRHALLALPGTSMDDVKRVRSHPQALAQCQRYLNGHGWIVETGYDTAGSARDLQTNPETGLAVIASRLAGQVYGLDVLDYPIEDIQHNYTRFFIVSRNDPPRSEQSKTSIVFSTSHVPGALHKCMGEFATRDINLAKIESRPSRDKPWHYVFYVDFEGHREDPVCAEALEGLQASTSFVKVLGSYAAAVMPKE
ncbi:MAG: prephenate dehydratase [Anaerolineales bacterium]|nr:MAG: prephenate dehydratase [Anaerolineales bacterium]